MSDDRERGLATENWLAILGGLSLGTLFGAGAVELGPLLVAAALCSGYLAIRVMQRLR